MIWFTFYEMCDEENDKDKKYEDDHRNHRYPRSWYLWICPKSDSCNGTTPIVDIWSYDALFSTLV